MATLTKMSIVLSLSLLSGCSMISTQELGLDGYECPIEGQANDNSAKEKNIRCKSTREMYGLTNNGKSIAESIDHSPRGKTHSVQLTGDNLLDTFVAPNIPAKPIPIRTPSTVMRVWMNSWENKEGVLLTPGFMYTEIEPRQWVIGQKPGRVDQANTFSPLSSN